MNQPLKESRFVAITRDAWEGSVRESSPDMVAHEEPLEIRLGTVPLAVVMRTPGHDVELGWGFALTERIVDDVASIRSIRYCPEVDVEESEENVLQILLEPGTEVDFARLKRNLFASSSCGICGKATRENALAVAAPIVSSATVDARVLQALPDRLRKLQEGFEATGGLHASGLFRLDGSVQVVREDVGRHNAVDKVIGWAIGAGASLEESVLMVSGRVSFEIVQKALAARIPFIAAVSAPTSLAVSLATDAGITLIGFLRGNRMNVYAGGARVMHGG
jgi:FdhD protein